jgi:hypothetical protein
LASDSDDFNPSSMEVGPDGTLYIGEWAFSSNDPDAGLYIFSPTGTESLVKSMDPGITGLDVDPNGNVYISSNNASGGSGGPMTSYGFGSDTAQQFSVYSPRAATLLRQFQDNVPGVSSVTVGADGTAYLLQLCCIAGNAPTSEGAVYKIPSGTSTVTDLIPREDFETLSLAVYSNGTARFARGRDRYAAGGHSKTSAMGMNGLERTRFMRAHRFFTRP